jgi:NAD(P)-dependent dehydrogenase (short-subunit alcohol dehydrogenase family)
MTVLREELLAGRAVALAGGVSDPVRDALVGLGARVEAVPGGDQLADDEARTGEWARAHAPLNAVVYDAASTFFGGGATALAATIEQGWVAVREVANGALIPAGAPGKVLLLGPRPDAGPLAAAACAALENLARTLSVEWARYGLTAAMVAPGETTTEQQLAELVCFLVSRAGEYFSGCRLDLGATG